MAGVSSQIDMPKKKRFVLDTSALRPKPKKHVLEVEHERDSVEYVRKSDEIRRAYMAEADVLTRVSESRGKSWTRRFAQIVIGIPLLFSLYAFFAGGGFFELIEGGHWWFVLQHLGMLAFIVVGIYLLFFRKPRAS